MNTHLDPDHDPDGTCWCRYEVIIHIPVEPPEASHDEQ